MVYTVEYYHGSARFTFESAQAEAAAELRLLDARLVKLEKSARATERGGGPGPARIGSVPLTPVDLSPLPLRPSPTQPSSVDLPRLLTLSC